MSIDERPLLNIRDDYRKLVPKLSENQFRVLEEDIIAKGRALEAIKVNSKREILDGHNRYEICQKHGCEYRIEVMEFSSKFD